MIGLRYAEESTNAKLSQYNTGNPVCDRQDGRTNGQTKLLYQYHVSALLC